MYQAPIVWLSAQLVVAPNLYLLGLFESRRFLNFFQAPYLQRLKNFSSPAKIVALFDTYYWFGLLHSVNEK